MATRVIDEFGSRANPPDAAYPDGSLKNETVPGSSNDGSPLDQRVGNDWEGFKQSALAEAVVSANGQPDSVTNPQILDSLKSVMQNNARFYTDIVYKASGGNSAVENMILQASIGETCLTEGVLWERIEFSSPPSIEDFEYQAEIKSAPFGIDNTGNEGASVEVYDFLRSLNYAPKIFNAGDYTLDFPPGNIKACVEINDNQVTAECDRDARFSIIDTDKGGFFVGTTTKDKFPVEFDKFDFTQVASSSPGGGGANNHPCIRISGLENASVTNTFFDTVSLGVSFHYQFEGTSDNLQNIYGLCAFNYFKDVEKQCIENIGAAYTRIVGNAVNSPRTNSNTIRLTGLRDAPDSANRPCQGVVGAGNTIYGGRGQATVGVETGAGIGCQNTTRGASFAANAMQNIAFGVNCINGTSNANDPRANYFQQTITDCGIGIYNRGCSYSTFDFVIDNFNNYGLQDDASTVDPTKGFNYLRGVIKGGDDCGTGSDLGRCMDIQHPNQMLDVLIDASEAGSTTSARVIGGGCTGRVSVFNSKSTSISLFGNGHTLTLTSIGSQSLNGNSLKWGCVCFNGKLR